MSSFRAVEPPLLVRLLIGRLFFFPLTYTTRNKESLSVSSIHMQIEIKFGRQNVFTLVNLCRITSPRPPVRTKVVKRRAIAQFDDVAFFFFPSSVLFFSLITGGHLV